MNKNQSTKAQLNNLIEFRQGLYEQGLDGYRDAQFELVDALLANLRVHSYAELTLSPLFRRDTLCQVPISMDRQGAAKAVTAVFGNVTLFTRYLHNPAFPVKKDAIDSVD